VVVWSVSAGVAVVLWFIGSRFSSHTLRWATLIIFLGLLLAITLFGVTASSTPSSDFGHSFTFAANKVSSDFLGSNHALGEWGWITVGVLLALGYRWLEAYTMRRQPPILDVSKLATAQPDLPAGFLDRWSKGVPAGQQHDWIAGELKFRLSAVEVRSPAILPGGARTDGIARIAEASGVTGASLETIASPFYEPPEGKTAVARGHAERVVNDAVETLNRCRVRPGCLQCGLYLRGTRSLFRRSRPNSEGWKE